MNTPSAIMINLPASFGAKEAKELGRELKDRFTMSAPSVVVDFSQVREMDSAGLDGLLACMRQVAMQDGAVQLGEVSPEAATMLEMTRMDRLFQKFPAPSAEVASFSAANQPAAEEVQSENVIPTDAVGQPQTVAA